MLSVRLFSKYRKKGDFRFAEVWVIIMDVSLILKIGGIGFLVSVICQVLTKSGREEQALLVSVSGMLLVLLLLVGQLGELIEVVRGVFGL